MTAESSFSVLTVAKFREQLCCDARIGGVGASEHFESRQILNCVQRSMEESG
jgi:hypothetical protein